jgi:hypothetical protein
MMGLANMREVQTMGKKCHLLNMMLEERRTGQAMDAKTLPGVTRSLGILWTPLAHRKMREFLTTIPRYLTTIMSTGRKEQKVQTTIILATKNIDSPHRQTVALTPHPHPHLPH